jgi:hypothetical protein
MRRTVLVAVIVLACGCGDGGVFMGACGMSDMNRRQRSNFAMTMAQLRNLFYALELYADRCGGYPATLAALDLPPSDDTGSCEHLGVLSDAIRAEGLYEEGDSLGMFDGSVERLSELCATGVAWGYRFRYVATDGQASGRFGSYSISADPLERGVSGFWSLWMSERGEIRRSPKSVAGPEDEIYETFSATGRHSEERSQAQ